MGDRPRPSRGRKPRRGRAFRLFGATFAVAGAALATAAIASPHTDGFGWGSTSTTQRSLAADVPPTSVDVYLTKSAPAFAAQNADYDYTLTVGNKGPDPATDVEVVDEMPFGLSLVRYPDDCAPFDVPGANFTVLDCGPYDLPAGATKTITFTVKALITGTIINAAGADSDQSDSDTDQTNNVATTTTTVGDVDIRLTKSAPPTVALGQNFTYHLGVTNGGPAVSPGVTVVDPLPAEVSVASLPPGCESDGKTPVATVSCTTGALAVGDSRDFPIEVRANATGTVTNTATISLGRAGTDYDPSNNSSSATTTIVDAFDLHLTKGGAPETASVGDTFDYAIRVSNAGPSPAFGVTVTDPLPSAVQTVPPLPNGCTAVGQVVTCALGTIGADETEAFNLTVKAVAAGLVTNTATAAAGAGVELDPTDNVASRTTNVTGFADLALTKTGPANANLGDAFSYTLHVANVGTATPAAANVVDPLPAEVALGAPLPGGCGATNTGTGTIVTCSFGPLAPGASKDFTVPVTAVGSGSKVTNIATLKGDGAVDGNPSNDSSSATTNIGFVDLQLTKDAPASTALGTPFDYTLVVKNVGTATSPAATVVDSLPSQVAPVTPLPAGCTADGNTVTCNVGPLAPGATATITLPVHANSPGAEVVNSATVTAAGDANNGNDTDSATTSIANQFDLALTKGAPATAAVGGTFAYTLTVKNNGPGTSPAATVVDALPAAVAPVTPLPAGCTADGNAVTCAVPMLAPAGAATITLTVKANAPGDEVTNTATVTAAGDTTSSNNTDSATTSISNQVDLQLTKTDDSDGLVALNDTFTYTLHVANAGPGTSTGATVVDTLPAQVALAGELPAGCDQAGRTITCVLETLGPGAFVTLAIDVKATQPGAAVTNTATVTAAGDSNHANDTSSSTTRIWDVNLSVKKSAEPSPVIVGHDLTYTIRVANDPESPTAAIDVVVTDHLPAGVEFDATAMMTEGCSYNAGSRTVTCDIGDVAPGETVDAMFSVKPTAAGTVTNTASVATDESDVDRNPSDNSASATAVVSDETVPVGNERVLILGSTVVSGANSPEALAATALGYNVDVVSDAQWAAKTTADFAKYRAIILGDRSCSSTYAAAEANTAVWSPAVNGNVIINGTDPVFHGKSLVTDKSVAFATAEPGKTGLYVSLSCFYAGAAATGVPVNVLAGIGSFVVRGAIDCAASVHIVATHPALVGLTDSYLSNWGCSVHESFLSWPASFLVLAIATNIGSSFTAPDGTTGTPYILARGAGLAVISDVKLAPNTAELGTGSTHTLTATVTHDGAAEAGKTVTFTVVSGPHAGTTGTATTNSDGNASFNYTGTAPGTDRIHATFVDDTGKTQTSNDVTATWTGPDVTPPAAPPAPPKSDVSVSISAPASGRVGQQVTVTATVSNAGPDAATGVVFNAPVPAGTTLVSATSSAGNGCTTASGISCFIGTLGAGKSAIVTMVFTLQQPGALTLSGSASGDYDSNAGNNSSSQTSTVLTPTAAPLPPAPPTTPGTFNAITVGTVLVNGQAVSADQVFVLKPGDVVDVTNGIMTFTAFDGSYITVSGQQLTVRTTSSVGGAAVSTAQGDVTAQFTITQAAAGSPTELSLSGGDFSGCPTQRSLSATNTTPVRQLWSSAKGSFRTKSRYSSATVRGTIWLTQDRCDGSLVSVTQGVVDVLDTVLQKTVSVPAGQSYLAKPKTAPLKPPAQKNAKKAAKKKARAAQAVYIVRGGDTLYRIAVTKLGKGGRWTDIARLNRLTPPYAIPPGTKLKLPRR